MLYFADEHIMHAMGIIPNVPTVLYNHTKGNETNRPARLPTVLCPPAGRHVVSVSLCCPPACRTTLETCHLPLSATRPRPSCALTTTAAGSQRAHAARHSNGTDALVGLLTMYCTTPFHSDQHQSWVVQNRGNPWLVRRKNRARSSPCTGEKINSLPALGEAWKPRQVFHLGRFTTLLTGQPNLTHTCQRLRPSPHPV